MATPSLRSTLSDAGEVPAAVRAVWSEVEDVITDGSATRSDLQHLAAEIDGQLDDIAAIRADLDQVDGEDQIRGTHPDQLVQAWKAERETRRQLVKLAGALLDLAEAVDRITDGDAREVYVSRQGDTLQRIAARLLGDWRAWTDLLEANPDLSPGPLASGTLVVIPERR